MAKLTSESAVRPPKRLVMPSTSRSAPGGAATALMRFARASSRLRTAEGSMPAGRKSIITTIASPKSSMRITSGSMSERPKIARCTGSTV